MIRLLDVAKTYGKVTVLSGVDLFVGKNEYVAAVGPSGSGKSTLMHLLGCLDRPDKGRYYLDGEDVYALPPKQLSRLRGDKIGFVFQGFQLLKKLTALENVALPLMLKGVKEKERLDRATLALTQVGLSDRLSHRPNQLSGGQQQRVAVARALIGMPPLILADEPTGNLDAQASKDVLALFRSLHEKGHTVVLITHDQKVAEAADRRIVVQNGNLSG